jgi:calcineurin-like phosphoesterase family protein
VSIFFTADHHFGHAKIIHAGHRPHASVNDMNADLVERWNSVVRPNDLVYHLGDVAFGALDDSLSNINRLNGRKILIPGNHDECWLGRRRNTVGGRAVARLTGSRERYLGAGFESIIDVTSLGHTLAVGGAHPISLSHAPYVAGAPDDDPDPDLSPMDDGLWLAHGHVLGAWRQRGRQINVGVDAWGGYPVPELAVAALMDQGEADLPPIPWG